MTLLVLLSFIHYSRGMGEESLFLLCCQENLFLVKVGAGLSGACDSSDGSQDVQAVQRF